MNLHDPHLLPGARASATPVNAPGSHHICILMAVYNGALHLEEQLQSLLNQSHADWSLVVGDDGSDDATLEILHRFACAHPDKSVRVVPGPRRGFQQNFLNLLRYVPKSARFVAFADQDDVWLEGKLARAVAKLGCPDDASPRLYGSRTVLTDTALDPLGHSPAFCRVPSFRNALVQSIAGGNTMVLNRSAYNLLKQAAETVPDLVSHDWWAYLIVSGAGGKVVFDDRSMLLYRQHGGNLVGAGSGLRAKLKRIRGLLDGKFRAYSDKNLAALFAASHLLTEANRETLARFSTARHAPLLQRLVAFRKLGLYRQTLAGTIALWCAAVLRRI